MPLNEKIEEIFHRWRWAENADDFLSEISTGSLGDPFPALVNYLSHEDEHFQTYALTIMMQLDAELSMNHVRTLIYEPNWQYHICELIFRYGGTKSIQPQVIEILNNSKFAGTRVMAALALGRIGDKNAIPVLQHAGKHDHEVDSGGWSVSTIAPRVIVKIQNA